MTNQLSQETLKINMDEPIDDFILHMSRYSDFSYEFLKEFDSGVKEEYNKRLVSCLNKDNQ